MRKISFIIWAMALVAASCGDDVEFEAGPQAKEAKETVYFTNDYDAEYYIGEDPVIEDTLWFTLGRTDTTKALDVPIIVEQKADCMDIPTTAHFDKGDSLTWIGMTYVGIKEGTTSPIVLRLGEEYSNPYAIKDGSSRLESKIIRAAWEEVCDTLLFITDSGNLPMTGCDLLYLPGFNRFKMTNFIGSGTSFDFSLTTGYNRDDVMKSKGEINPKSYYYDDTNMWYFTNGGAYAPWYLTDSSGEILADISYLSFWKGNTYTFINLKREDKNLKDYKIKGVPYNYDSVNYSLMTAYVNYTSGKSGWEYIYLFLCNKAKK